MRVTHYLTAAFIGLGAILTLGCHDSTAPVLIERLPNGHINVTVSTVSDNVDALPEAYGLGLHDVSSLSIGVNTSMTIDEVPLGTYMVTLYVPANCSVAGTNPRPVNVDTDGATAALSFSVSCTGKLERSPWDYLRSR